MFDARLYDGGDPLVWHNRYPEEWARVSREAIEEAGRGEDIAFFDRSGFTQSPGIATLFWLGDQMQTWDEYDGIKTAVVGLLSGGVSGFSLLHSDTGGYVAVEGRRGRAADPGDRAHAGAPDALDGAQRLHRGVPHPRGARPGGLGAVRHRRGDAGAYACASPESTRGWPATGRGWWPRRRRPGHRWCGISSCTIRTIPTSRGCATSSCSAPDLMVAPVLDRGAEAVEVYFPEGGRLDRPLDRGRGGDTGRVGADAGAAGDAGGLPAQGGAGGGGHPRGLRDVGVLG